MCSALLQGMRNYVREHRHPSLPRSSSCTCCALYPCSLCAYTYIQASACSVLVACIWCVHQHQCCTHHHYPPPPPMHTLLQYTKPEQVTERAPSGCYVSGMFLEGGCWDHPNMCLRKSPPKVLIEELPILRVIPIEASRLKLQVRVESICLSVCLSSIQQLLQCVGSLNH